MAGDILQREEYGILPELLPLYGLEDVLPADCGDEILKIERLEIGRVAEPAFGEFSEGGFQH